MTKFPTFSLFAAALGTMTAVIFAGCAPARAVQASPTLVLARSTALSPAAATADETLAASDLLQLTDVPAGWTVQGKVETGYSKSLDANSPQDATAIEHLALCIGKPALAKTNTPEADSPSWGNAAGTETFQEDIDVYPSASAARADAEEIDNPRTPTCLAKLIAPYLKQSLKSSGNSNLKMGKIVGHHSSFPAMGNVSAAVEIVVPVTEDGVNASLYLTLAAIVQGNLEANLTYFGVVSPFPTTTEDQLATAVFSHLSS